MLVLVPFIIPAVVIAESWPVWLTVCSPRIGFVCRRIYFGGAAQWWVRSTVAGLSAARYDPASLDSVKEPHVLLLSGSTSFIAGILGRCGFNSSYICALDLDSKPSEHLLGQGTWCPFRHIDYGGVTSGTWWFGANIKDWTQPQPTRSALRVGHVLSDTVGGKPCPGPVEPETTMDEVTYLSDSRVLDAGGLFPVKAVRTLVACPSVYSQSRWVARCLFTHELGRCFDLGESCLQPFPDKPISNVKISSLPFLLSPPVRIALAVGNECARLLPQSQRSCQRLFRKTSPRKTA
jgi:hypothetical protein